jgi:pyruvate,orthophosphate dikinase
MAPASERMIKFGNGLRTEAPVEVFGNKASVLAEIASIGIPVPPGFSLSIAVCDEYFKNGRKLPSDVPEMLKEGIAFLEKLTGLVFGSDRKPLLVSVRSGSPVSMPGAMETVLNVGLNRTTVKGLIHLTGNPRFAWDSYRRLIEGFGKTVYGQDPTYYSSLLRSAMEAENLTEEMELDFMTLRNLTMEYERVFLSFCHKEFPSDVYEQLELAVRAVLDSWMKPKAVEFRKMKSIEGVLGTAVTVQAMVFGNMGMRSGSGVMFTRNPWSGEKKPLIEFKFGAQGEDVVSGYSAGTAHIDMRSALPNVYAQLLNYAQLLEEQYRDMQDMEFTVQEGKLYILQSRSGKRTPLASLRIAVDMYIEGKVNSKEALQMIDNVDVDNIFIQEIDTRVEPIGKGDAASAGVVSGKIVFSPAAVRTSCRNGNIILVRETPSSEDIPAVNLAKGYLTARGGRTSHAAVVARQLGKICIVNCTSLQIDLAHGKCRIGEKELSEYDVITLDGNSGMIYQGEVKTKSERPLDLLAYVRHWKKENM